MKSRSLLSLILLSLLPMLVSAQGDTNQTDAPVKTQAQEKRLAEVLKKFPQADLNKDGTLTREEALAFRAKMQKRKKNKVNYQDPKLPAPTHSNVRYGTHERNVMDIWIASSDQPTPLVVNIHGGGFKGGDKSKISSRMIEMMLDEGISVASINYRFKEGGKSRFEGDDPQYPDIMHDGARALQFLRYHSAKYNLDKSKFAATGGSAGGNMLMWLGFHDDLAQPDHEDPVLRESSRLQVLAPRGGQTTVHPLTLMEWFGVESLNLSKQEGVVISTKDMPPLSEKMLNLMLDASAITHLTKDDPPIYLYYGGPNNPVTESTLWGTWVHHPILGIKLKEAMDAKDMECHLEYRNGPPVTEYASQNDFIIKKLTSLR